MTTETPIPLSALWAPLSEVEALKAENAVLRATGGVSAEALAAALADVRWEAGSGARWEDMPARWRRLFVAQVEEALRRAREEVPAGDNR